MEVYVKSFSCFLASDSTCDCVCSGSRLQRGRRRREDSAVQTSGRLGAAAAPPDGLRLPAGWRPHRGHRRRSVGSSERGAQILMIFRLFILVRFKDVL